MTIQANKPTCKSEVNQAVNFIKENGLEPRLLYVKQ